MTNTKLEQLIELKNKYIAMMKNDGKEIFRQGASPDHHICNHVPKFKYRA